MPLLYRLATGAYHTAIKLASLRNRKASDWVEGRKELWEKLSNLPQGKKIWFHCASLGEFEQGRPLIERLRSEFPDHLIVLTFFSPSGYNQRKNYPGAHVVTYIPADTPHNAKRFLDLLKPEFAVFVKYEYWYYLLNGLFEREIPVYLVSAVFRPGQIFFKPYGAMFFNLLKNYRNIFLQDKDSAKLLENAGLANFQVAGDTRFDRVLNLPELPLPDEAKSLPSGQKVVVAGSTWPDDEKMLASWWNREGKDQGWRIVIAPHETDRHHLSGLKLLFPEAVFFSEKFGMEAAVVIIDRIGLLNRIYRLASVCYIGGGFGKGIHNTLEAAVYGKPVLFGPNYGKFREAHGLIDAGAAFSVAGPEEFSIRLKYLNQQAEYIGKAGAEFVAGGAGATDIILNSILLDPVINSRL